MRISATLDVQKLEESLDQLAREARVAPGIVIKEETKQILQAVLKLTPPSTYAQGRAAVNRDLGKVFTTLPAIRKRIGDISFEGKEAFQAALTRASKANDESAVRKLLTQQVNGQITVQVGSHQRNGVSIPGYTQTRRVSGPMMPELTGGTQIGGSLNPSLHTSRRDAKGRVQGNQLSQVVTKSKGLSDYRKDVLSRTGWAMAGWAILARQVGAKIPNWVAKTRLESVSGVSTTNFGRDAFVRATNLDVKIPGYQRVVDIIVATRIRVTARKIQALVAGRAVNLGFTRVAAR